MPPRWKCATWACCCGISGFRLSSWLYGMVRRRLFRRVLDVRTTPVAPASSSNLYEYIIESEGIRCVPRPTSWGTSPGICCETSIEAEGWFVSTLGILEVSATGETTRAVMSTLDTQSLDWPSAASCSSSSKAAMVGLKAGIEDRRLASSIASVQLSSMALLC